MKRVIEIAHLYAKEMNIYGDTGNIMALSWRLKQRGIKAKITRVGTGSNIPKTTDIILVGGGQDSGQFRVEKDLKSKSKEIRAMHEDGVIFLAICGTYQLFGHKFETLQGTIEGIGLFDMETTAGSTRMIGNTLIDAGELGELVGFENHSGRTTLNNKGNALGKVLKGAGNNDEDYTEGCISKNAFGTYMHGPALPKNPKLADELISRALLRKYGKDTQLAQIDDSYSVLAAEIAKKLPR